MGIRGAEKGCCAESVLCKVGPYDFPVLSFETGGGGSSIPPCPAPPLNGRSSRRGVKVSAMPKRPFRFHHLQDHSIILARFFARRSASVICPAFSAFAAAPFRGRLPKRAGFFFANIHLMFSEAIFLSLASPLP